MGIPILGDIINTIGGIVSKSIVDKDKVREINFELAKLEDVAQSRIDAQVLAQIEVNKTEALSGSVFVAGWRPAVGWVGALGLAYSTLFEPFLSWGARVCGYSGEFPVINNELLLYVLGGMLGLGGMRTYEKVKGVSTNNYTDVPKVS